MNNINFDPNNFKAMRRIMDKYGENGLFTTGESASGESVTLSVCKTYITTETLQRNGVTRINVYWYDGTTEELYRH